MNANKFNVILGTAHGANVGGKRSPDGRFYEYRYSREIAPLVKKELEKLGYNVYVDIMDNYVPTPQGAELRKRVDFVNRICKGKGTKYCVYVSIHNNAAGSDGNWHNASGFSVFVSDNASLNSKKLAKIFTSNALRNDLCGNRSIPTQKYWSANLYVLRNTYCPAVLTENLFQDNKKDVDFLLSDDGKKEIVKLHVDSINEYVLSL